MASNKEFRRVRLEPDTKAAESLSRRIWQGGAKSRSQRAMAGRKVYRHEPREFGKE